MAGNKANRAGVDISALRSKDVKSISHYAGKKMPIQCDAARLPRRRSAIVAQIGGEFSLF
jgi:hypothetical protein